ncbi:hypothetical protein DKP78_14910 [Enterococcus faecium]|nr:hypothetical protein DKP78_14910 [Enterococcus faecium]
MEDVHTRITLMVVRLTDHLVSSDVQVKVETRVEKGDPRDVICGAVEKAGADMVVMGSHAYGFLQRTLLGSVSNHCVQHCKCPVVFVKRPGTNAKAS